MNFRALFVCVTVAAVTATPGPGLASSLWGKVGGANIATPARMFLKELQVPPQVLQQTVAKQAVAVEEPVKVETAKPPVEEPKEEDEEFVDQEEEEPARPEVPIFAKLLIGDPAYPQLASVEELRNLEWRHVDHSLELPNSRTIPLVNELLQKTEEILRLYQAIQDESNAFVEEVHDRRHDGHKEYIGYYN